MLAGQHLKGDAAVKAVADNTWDVSVRSMVAFPSVLTQMNIHLDWTQKLGDALIGQQQDVVYLFITIGLCAILYAKGEGAADWCPRLADRSTSGARNEISTHRRRSNNDAPCDAPHPRR